MPVLLIVEMVRRGYAGQLTLSHDCCCWSDFFPQVSDYREAMPRHNYLHIHNDVLPALRKAGVSEVQINAMFIDNPRRLFTQPG